MAERWEDSPTGPAPKGEPVQIISIDIFWLVRWLKKVFKKEKQK
jgi:hypothetical protein